MPERLLIRADASIRCGTGHVMRCLALAQGWQRAGGKALFVQAETTPAIDRRLRAEGFQILSLGAEPGSHDDARQTIRFAGEHSVTWVVADGYKFDAEYQRRIKEAGLRLLLLDDYGHAEHYWADYVLNQNLFADAKLYSSREPYTQLLIGTRYVLLRQEFEKWRDWKRKIPAVARKVLVTLGGSDPDNVTGKVVQALERLRNERLDCVVVVGGSNPHLKELQAQCKNGKLPIRLVVDVADMPELMAWADMAVAAGGSTAWELAFMGLPNPVIVLADNQTESAAALDHEGVIVNLGGHAQVTGDRIATVLQPLLTDSDRRRQMSQHGRKLVDGLGIERVVRLLADDILQLTSPPSATSRAIVSPPTPSSSRPTPRTP